MLAHGSIAFHLQGMKDGRKTFEECLLTDRLDPMASIKLLVLSKDIRDRHTHTHTHTHVMSSDLMFITPQGCQTHGRMRREGEREREREKKRTGQRKTDQTKQAMNSDREEFTQEHYWLQLLGFVCLLPSLWAY